MAQAAARQPFFFEPRLRTFEPGNLRRLDWLLLAAVVALAVIGWFTLYSANRSSEVFDYRRQIAYFGAGLALALFVACVDYRKLLWLAPGGYAVVIVLLWLTLSMGREVKGGARWLDLGVVGMQPSELAKIALLMFYAWYFGVLGERVRAWYWFALSFLIAAPAMALILRQPDLGTAMCLAPLALSMVFLAGCRWWHIGLVLLLGLAAAPVLWLQMANFDPDADPEATPHSGSVFELKRHQKMRIYSFLNPDYDPQGSGWHSRQSMITVGSGGLSGKGFLNSTQTRLKYLPEHHTDFIFSLYAEERGFLGGVIILGLYGVLLFRGISFARRSLDLQGTLLAAGVVTILGFHIFVNIAITIGLMPVTGIPLPFLSYGGTFYLSTMMGIGLLLSVSARRAIFSE